MSPSKPRSGPRQWLYRQWYVTDISLGSYHEVYEALIIHASSRAITVGPSALLSQLIVILAGSQIILPHLNGAMMWREYWFGIALSLFLTSYTIIFFCVALAASSMGKKVKFLAAHLLISSRRPHDTNNGLNYTQVCKVEQIAEIEQSAADWRNSVINLTIVSLISLVILSFSLVLYVVFNGLAKPEEGSVGYMLQTEFRLGVNESVIFIIVAAVIFLLLVRIYLYLFEFVVKEPANRAVLMACVEAKAVLEEKELTNVTVFPLEQKQILARYLNHRIVPQEPALREASDDNVGGLKSLVWFHEPDGTLYDLASNKRSVFGRSKQLLSRIRSWLGERRKSTK